MRYLCRYMGDLVYDTDDWKMAERWLRSRCSIRAEVVDIQENTVAKLLASGQVEWRKNDTLRRTLA